MMLQVHSPAHEVLKGQADGVTHLPDLGHLQHSVVLQLFLHQVYVQVAWLLVVLAWLNTSATVECSQ